MYNKRDSSGVDNALNNDGGCLVFFQLKAAIFWLIAASFFTSSCAWLKKKKNLNLSVIQVNFDGTAPALALRDANNTSAGLVQPAPYTPEKISDFSCIFTNAMGEDIGSWDSRKSGVIDNPGSSYFELYSTVSTNLLGDSFTLVVPNGSQRIIQVLGVISTDPCPTVFSAADIDNLEVMKGIFEIGRTVADINGSQIISVNQNYVQLQVKDARRYLLENLATIDGSLPQPGSAIHYTNTNGIPTLSWTAATDAATTQNYLLYKVVSSTDINDLANVGLALETTVAADWAFNVTSFAIPSTATDTIYTVLVRDAVRNIGQYTPFTLPLVPQLTYSTDTVVLPMNSIATITPSVLNPNGMPISACAIKAGSTALPSWATLDPLTCVVSGTPLGLQGTSTYSIQAQNAVGTSNEALLILRVGPGVPTLSYTGSTGGAGTFGSLMTVTPSTLTINGGALSACGSKADSTALPSWASVDPGSCVISGTPNALLTPSTFTLVATNAAGKSADATVVVSVAAGLPLLSYSGVSGTAGSVGTALTITPSSLNGQGAAVTSCAIKSGSTALPAWASIDPSTCVISGTPTATLTSTTYTITAANSVGNANDATLTLSVTGGAPVLSYTSATGTSGSVGVAMSVAPSVLTTNGLAITNCALSGTSPALPSWASINTSTCVISGTPSAALSATTYSLQASNSFGSSASASVTLTVVNGAPVLSYTSSTGTTGAIGTVMTVSPSFLSNGGSTVTGCALKAGTTALPGWASVNASTCAISGTPDALLSATSYTIQVSNALGNSSSTVSLSVGAGVPLLSYSGATGTSGTYNVSMSVSPTTLTTQGASITACAIKTGTTALPSGLSVAATTCVISGTPTTALSSTSFTVQATNSTGTSADATVSLSIAAVVPQLSYSGATGTSGNAGVAMTVTPTTFNAGGTTLTACGIKPSTTALPSWASVSTTTCVISGTPTGTLSSTPYTMRATNSAGNSSDAAVTLVVAAGAPTLSYASATGTSGNVGTSMSITPTTLTANGASVTACAIKGGTAALPAGLSVAATTCVISGTPTEITASATYTLQATNSAGTSTDATVVLVVSGVTGCTNGSFSGGSGTSGSPFQVANATDLTNTVNCNSSNYYFQQTASINLGGSGSPWTPLVLYAHYDGNSQTISNVYVHSSTSGNNVGLFSTIQSGATVSNLTLSSVDLQGFGHTGALAGQSSGTITNVSSSGATGLNYNANTSVYYAGGLIGKLAAGTVTSSSSSATVSLTFSDNGNTSNTFSGALGGLVGGMASSTTITSSYATGAVNGGISTNATSGNFGGLVGYLTSATITQSYSTGNVTYSGNGTSGIGMVGYGSSATISKCFSSGAYSLASSGYIRYAYVGGMVGNMSGGSIANSYSMITIGMPTFQPVNGGAAGGLVGNTSGSITISTSYAAPVSMSAFAAGTIKGFSGVTFSSGLTNVFLYKPSGSIPADTSTGLTSVTASSDITTQGTFTGFTFSTIWSMPTANPLSPGSLLSPVLNWQCGANGITCASLRSQKRSYQRAELEEE